MAVRQLLRQAHWGSGEGRAMKTLIISPHLDDAALSCAVRLAAREIDEVVTIFAGVPPEREPRSDWDILTRADSAYRRVLERRAEDAAAWTSIGMGYVHSDHLEARGEQIDRAQLVSEISDLARRFERVLVPAGIGRHPQHVLVRDAALAAITPDTAVLLYGELPYAAFYGWPAAERYLDVEALWMAELADIPRGSVGPPVLVALDEAQRGFKRALLSHYPSQMRAVSGGSFKLFETTAFLDYELEFPLG